MKSLNKEFTILNLRFVVVEQEAATQGIKISKKIKLVLVTRQEIVILPKEEVTVVEGVHVVVKVRYNEPRLNQQNVNIVKGVLRDWSRGIHSANRIPKT